MIYNSRGVRRTVGVAMVLALSLGACGDDDDSGADSAAPESGSESALVVGVPADPPTLDHPKQSDNVKDLVVWRIIEPLIDLNTDSELVPVLATEIPTIDAADPTLWTLELREGVEFSNGEPFNAEAVVANVERVLDPEFEAGFAAAELATLESATAVDEYTVELRTKAPDPDFDFKLPFLRLAAPEYAADWDQQANAPIGTGPYEFVSWDVGSELRIEANEGYWGEQPSIDSVTFRVIPDEGTRLQALQAGEIHLAMAVSPDQGDEIPQLLTASEGSQVGFARPDYSREPFSDIRFRQALNYALDKEQLSESIFGGAFVPASCQLTPVHAVGSNPDLEPWPYDPEKARSLLEEAGVEEGFSFEIIWPEELFGKDREFGEAIASMWRAVGLDPNLNISVIQDVTDGFFAKGEGVPDIVYSEVNTPYPHAVRTSSLIYDEDGAASGNVGPYDPQFQELIGAAFTELDRERQIDLYHEAQARQCDEALYIYLLERRATWGASADISYEPGPELFGRIFWEDVTLSN